MWWRAWAKYTGWDLGLLRFLFVLSIFFFGTGVLLYLILWSITPEAKTLTDKMQMTGEPITLENIETNVKRSLSVENQPENTITKILLLPFRALAAIFSAIGPLFVFLLVVLRVFAGGLLIVIGTSVLIGLFVAMLAGFGTLGMVPVMMGDIPIALISDASPWLFVFGLLAMGIPFLALAISGASLLVKRNLFNARLGLPLVALWIFGMVGATALGTSYATNYQRGAEVEKIQIFPAASVARFDLRDNADDSWNHTRLTLEGYEGADIQLVQTFVSRGRSRADAEANATALVYTVGRKDSTLVFDKRAELTPGRPFRGQELQMTLKIPYGKPFRMSERFAYYVTNRFSRELFDKDEFNNGVFKIEKDGIVCVNCSAPAEPQDDDKSGEFNDDDENNDGFQMGRGEFSREEKVGDFEKLDIAGAFYVEVKQGATYRVELDGNRRDVGDVRVRRNGNTLEIGYENGWRMFRNRRAVNVRITMPSLRGVEFSGPPTLRSRVSTKIPTSTSKSVGASRATFTSLNAQKIEASVSGAGQLTLLGNARELRADISGASQLKALNLKALEADIDATGASGAHVYVLKKLSASASGASRVGYKGEANVDKTTSGGSSVEPEEDGEPE